MLLEFSLNLLKCSVLLFLLLQSSRAQAYFVDYLKVQYAGEIGFLSIGMGKRFGEIYSLEVFNGYVPKSIGGSEIEAIAIKNLFDLIDFSLLEKNLIFYFGVNIYHVTGLDYQSSRHSSYPEQYYRLGSIRGLFSFGLDLNITADHGVYFESGLNDIILTNYFNNPDDVDVKKYVSHGFGYKYIF